MKEPLVFIAFGVTGELMKRKILPALLQLQEKGQLPEQFTLVGISRRPADELKDSFGQNFYHVQGDANEPETYTRLKELLDSLGPAQKIFYISTSPALYKTIFTHLLPFAENSKLMIEKPFGIGGTEAQALNEILHQSFDESQIYRVDHYLAKESLQFRGGTAERFYPTDSLEKIEAFFCETGGVEKRGASYDTVGALRDVGQNHLLEMLAVTLAHNRTDFLEEISHAPAEAASHSQHVAYATIAGVAPGSRTETAFSVRLKWRGVPVTLLGGKYQPGDKKEIVITHTGGRVERFPITENTKESEYERLILDCALGKKDLFVSEREVSLLWGFVDPIIKAWYH